MAELFILEIEGFGADEYKKVNDLLGIDMDSGEGNWPHGLVSHASGAYPGGWRVVEVWDSQADQEAFMTSRLSAALHQAGVDKPPSKAEWTKLHRHHMPKQKAAAG
ncbi:MAG: hypothetical protein ABI352_03590 [Candidatus Dormibacter sp.]